MENLSNLYSILGQNNGHKYANEDENHLPEFLQFVNMVVLRPNFHLDFDLQDIVPARETKLLHVAFLWMRPDF